MSSTRWQEEHTWGLARAPPRRISSRTAFRAS